MGKLEPPQKKVLCTFVAIFSLCMLLSTTTYAKVKNVGISHKEAAKIIDNLDKLPEEKKGPMKEAVNKALDNPAVLELMGKYKNGTKEPKRRKWKKRTYEPIGKYWE